MAGEKYFNVFLCSVLVRRRRQSGVVKFPASVVDVGCTATSLVFHITGSRPDANCSSPAAWVTLGPDTLYGCIHTYAPRNLDTFLPSIDGLPRQPYKHYSIEPRK